MNIKDQLISMKDEKHKEFIAKLIPTIDKKSIRGIKNPVLRKFAKEIYKNNEHDAMDFVSKPNPEFLEETMLKLFIIENIKDYNLCIKMINQMLPYIDNWALSDTFNPPILKKYLTELLEEIYIWIDSAHLYTRRFAMVLLLRHYLKNDNFDVSKHIKLVLDRNDDRYYIQMMVAWYLSMALVHRYELALPYLKNNYLDKWTHNKAIQKAIESRQMSDERKNYLRTLKRAFRE